MEIALLILFLIYAAMLEFISWPDHEKAQGRHYEPDVWPDVSVVLCMRNEEERLEECLDSLLGQDFRGRYEILIFDDSSTDRSTAIVHSIADPRLSLIDLSGRVREGHRGSGKKEAITRAVEMSRSELILVTDADTVHDPSWITTLASRLERDCEFVSGAVLIAHPKGLLSHFQTFEYLAIQTATAGGAARKWFFGASGANMGFRKATFKDLDPYSTNYKVASGDDVFLVEAMRRRGKRIEYLIDPASIAYTAAEPSWAGAIRQRIRWGAKARHYSGSALNIPWFLSGLFNLSICLALVFSLAGFSSWLWAAGIALVLKALADYRFILPLLRISDISINPVQYALCSLIYPFFISLVIFKSAFTRKLEWKGREVGS